MARCCWPAVSSARQFQPSGNVIAFCEIDPAPHEPRHRPVAVAQQLSQWSASRSLHGLEIVLHFKGRQYWWPRIFPPLSLVGSSPPARPAVLRCRPMAGPDGRPQTGTPDPDDNISFMALLARHRVA